MSKSELLAAVERLRINNYPDSRDTSEGMYVSETRQDDVWTVIPAYLAELDETPVDLEWVKSIGDDAKHGWYIIGVQPNKKNVYLIEFPSGWELRFAGESIRIYSPTRGQVVTACRLFGVELKASGK